MIKFYPQYTVRRIFNCLFCSMYGWFHVSLDTIGNAAFYMCIYFLDRLYVHLSMHNDLQKCLILQHFTNHGWVQYKTITCVVPLLRSSTAYVCTCRQAYIMLGNTSPNLHLLSLCSTAHCENYGHTYILNEVQISMKSTFGKPSALCTSTVSLQPFQPLRQVF